MDNNDNNIKADSSVSSLQTIPKNEIDPLFNEISSLLETARSRVNSAINITMVNTYYNIGKLIVNNEQNGRKRAEYGKEVIKKSFQTTHR